VRFPVNGAKKRMHIPGGAGKGELITLATAVGDVIGTGGGDNVVVGLIENVIAAAVEMVVP
jgi:hypothetical protein